jgi:hypothetical protein
MVSTPQLVAFTFDLENSEPLGEAGPEKLPAASEFPDVNGLPINIVAVKGKDGTSALYEVGHASGPCCSLVSGHLAEAQAALPGSWLSFGFARLSANEPSAKARLDALLAQLQEDQKSPVCANELRISLHAADDIAQRSRRAEELGTLALTDSATLDRAVMLWYDLSPNELTLARPMTGGGSLRFELDVEELRLPPIFAKPLSVGGVNQYVSELRRAIDGLERLKRLRDIARRINGPVGFTGYEERVTTNYRGDLVEKINNATAGIRQVRQRWEIYAALLSELGQGNHATDSLRGLDEHLAVNREAVAAARALPSSPISNIPTLVSYRSVQPSRAPEPVLERLKVASVDQELATAKAQLKAVLEHPPPPTTDPIPQLVDALLRGWNATFAEEEPEREFDKWMLANQARIWKLLCERARDKFNATLGDCSQPEQSLLARSNTVFVVDRAGQKLTVEPYTIVTGRSLQVASSRAGLAFIESATADQNRTKLADFLMEVDP